MTIKLYNTLTRSKDEFKPLKDGEVRMYVCGPTVYARPHIGNARSVVVYDVLYRLLKHLYPNVTYVRNITDVDDKINAAAIERGISIQALTKEVTQWFHDDMDALGCLRPTKEPKATEHIKEMIAIIESLIKNGHAYVAEGHVLFDVTKKLPAGSGFDWKYGMLSGRIQEDLEAGARVKVESYKKQANDFVLWKPTDADDDPSSVFDSPWGKGRPGWHIECSAMSSNYLGNDFDIHGGGADLMFPHHENEIAQSCCAYPGSSYAKFWVHNGFLTVNGEKMSKSLGNFITVRDLLDKGVKDEVIRLALLSTHYRAPLNWTEKLYDDAKNTLDRFYRAHEDMPLRGAGDYTASLFGEDLVISDDLNIATHLSEMHEISKQINRADDEIKKQKLQRRLRGMGNLIGILQQDPKEWMGRQSDVRKAVSDAMKVHGMISPDEKIQQHVNARTAAKQSKNWKEADRIREELKAQGIILEDKPDGTTDWRRA